MFGFDGRCPRCGGSRLWQSSSGWLRLPAQLVFLYPLRCDHCQSRFWRFLWSPPRAASRRSRSGSQQRVKSNGDLDTPPTGPAR